jgi:hypothetical protein
MTAWKDVAKGKTPIGRAKPFHLLKSHRRTRKVVSLIPFILNSCLFLIFAFVLKNR